MSFTRGTKFGNCDNLDAGFINENSLVENRYVIAKIFLIEENRNDPTKVIEYEEQSRRIRTNKEAHVDKKFTGRNGGGNNFAEVRVRVFRKPVMGDKFLSHHDQNINPYA